MSPFSSVRFRAWSTHTHGKKIQFFFWYGINWFPVKYHNFFSSSLRTTARAFTGVWIPKNFPRTEPSPTTLPMNIHTHPLPPGGWDGNLFPVFSFVANLSYRWATEFENFLFLSLSSSTDLEIFRIHKLADSIHNSSWRPKRKWEGGIRKKNHLPMPLLFVTFVFFSLFSCLLIRIFLAFDGGEAVGVATEVRTNFVVVRLNTWACSGVCQKQGRPILTSKTLVC